MRNAEFTNLLEGIKRSNYEHVEEVLQDISELGVEFWMDSMTKACQVRELGAVKRFATFVADSLRIEANASPQREPCPFLE